jgi:hypothetical protein
MSTQQRERRRPPPHKVQARGKASYCQLPRILTSRLDLLHCSCFSSLFSSAGRLVLAYLYYPRSSHVPTYDVLMLQMNRCLKKGRLSRGLLNGRDIQGQITSQRYVILQHITSYSVLNSLSVLIFSATKVEKFAIIGLQTLRFVIIGFLTSTLL